MSPQKMIKQVMKKASGKFSNSKMFYYLIIKLTSV